MHRFKSTGSVCDNKKGMVGRHRSARTQDSVAPVREVLPRSPRRTVPRYSQSLGMKRTSTHSIRWWDLTLYPCKIQVLQMPTAANSQRRRRDFFQFVQLYPIILDCLWFSDESHFPFDGFVKKLNMRFRVSESPQSRGDVTPSCRMHHNKAAIPTATAKWGHSGSRARGHNTLRAGWSTPTYSECRLGRPGWCVREPYPVQSISRVLRVWIVVATTFTGHEYLRLFPVVLRQR